jgi:hypothetical protein
MVLFSWIVNVEEGGGIESCWANSRSLASCSSFSATPSSSSKWLLACLLFVHNQIKCFLNNLSTKKRKEKEKGIITFEVVTEEGLDDKRDNLQKNPSFFSSLIIFSPFCIA